MSTNICKDETPLKSLVNVPDNVESTTIRIALYIKSGYTTFWIWWHKALEKRVGLSSNWDTLDEKRDVRHINLGFYEEWLRTEARLKYMAKTYPQTFTKIYMVTKPDFVVKPDTEYVVIIMRVDGEFRTIACPREIFLETKLGDAIMSEDNTTLTNMGLEDADISGFSEGKISPYVYGLITKNDATSTIWNKVVAAITQNTSGVKIANIVQMSKILLPKDIVKMIPLSVLPQQGKSLPEYMSPEASIWAAMVGFITEVGRLLCELFMALANFLARFLETIAEWGLKLLGALLEVLSVAKYLFAMALCVWSWIEAALFAVVLLFVNCFLSLMGFNVEDYIHIFLPIDLPFGTLTIYFGIDTYELYGFYIATLNFSISVVNEYGSYSVVSLSTPLVPFLRILGQMSTYHTASTRLCARSSGSAVYIADNLLAYSLTCAGSLPLSSIYVLIYFLYVVGAYLMAGARKVLGYIIAFSGFAVLASTYWWLYDVVLGNTKFKRFSDITDGLVFTITSAALSIVNIIVAILWVFCIFLAETKIFPKYDDYVDVALTILIGFVGWYAMSHDKTMAAMFGLINLLYYSFYRGIAELSGVLRSRMRSNLLCLIGIFTIISISGFIGIINMPLSPSQPLPSVAPDLTPPSIGANIKELSATSNRVATINATIEISDSAYLHYIVIDLASDGAGYNPTHPELKRHGSGSRISAKRQDKILTIVAIHRLEDGTLDICVLGESYSLIGDGSVHDNVTWTHTKNDVNYSGWLFFNITRSGESIEIVLNGTVYDENIMGGETLYLVTWACDWIDNEALLIADPPEGGAYVKAHKPLSYEVPMFLEDYSARVFSVGHKLYQCITHVGVEFYAQHCAVLSVGGSSSTYSSGGGLWGCIAVNASDWDSLCDSSPAILTIDGHRYEIHFLKYPFYYTLLGGIMALCFIDQAWRVLRGEEESS